MQKALMISDPAVEFFDISNKKTTETDRNLLFNAGDKAVFVPLSQPKFCYNFRNIARNA